MNPDRFKVFFSPGVILLSLASLVGCSNLEMTSTWCDRKIAIDGIDSEWQETMVYVEDADLGIGLQNDETFMYICLGTTDRRVLAQIIGLGFTVWFDPEGGKTKTLGIRFPLGMHDPMKLRQALQDQEALERDLAYFLGNELEILGPEEGEQVRRLLSVTGGIKAGSAMSAGRFIYELRVPLSPGEDYAYAIGAEPGASIGLGFETSWLEEMVEQEGFRGGLPPGGGGGRRRGGGVPGGQGPPEGRGRPERLELWMTVNLAPGDGEPAD